LTSFKQKGKAKDAHGVHARCEGTQSAHKTWNDFITEKYVPSKHKTFEVLIAMKILIVVFWTAIPCEHVGGYQHDSSAGMTQYAPPKSWNPSMSPHKVSPEDYHQREIFVNTNNIVNHL
jgi:hypothetical protein